MDDVRSNPALIGDMTVISRYTWITVTHDRWTVTHDRWSLHMTVGRYTCILEKAHDR